MYVRILVFVLRHAVGTLLMKAWKFQMLKGMMDHLHQLNASQLKLHTQLYLVWSVSVCIMMMLIMRMMMM